MACRKRQPKTMFDSTMAPLATLIIIVSCFETFGVVTGHKLGWATKFAAREMFPWSLLLLVVFVIWTVSTVIAANRKSDPNQEEGGQDNGKNA